MARMIPEKISSATKSYAEKALFQIFEKSLSDDYVVFHGAWWQHIGYIVQDREADFIIIHPDRGIIILEAKLLRCSRMRGSGTISRSRDLRIPS